MLEGWAGVTVGNLSWTKGLSKAFKGIKDQSSLLGKAFGQANKKMNKSGESVGKFVNVFEGVKKAFGGIFSVGMDVVGILFQLFDKMGVLEPVMNALGLIFQLIGAEALPLIMEALVGLYDQIMEMDWSEIGAIVADFFIWLLEGLVQLLGDPKFMNAIKVFLVTFADFAKGFLGVVVGFMKWISGLDVGGLKVAITVLAAFMAFMWGYGQGASISPAVGIALGVAMAGLAAGAVGMMMASFAEGGIVTRPMLGMVGEAGRNEAIIPLEDDNTMPGSEELLDATITNNQLLARLLMATEEQNRIKRLKYL